MAEASAAKKAAEAAKVELAAAEQARANAKALAKSQKAARLARDARVKAIHDAEFSKGQQEQHAANKAAAARLGVTDKRGQ